MYIGSREAARQSTSPFHVTSLPVLPAGERLRHLLVDDEGDSRGGNDTGQVRAQALVEAGGALVPGEKKEERGGEPWVREGRETRAKAKIGIKTSSGGPAGWGGAGRGCLCSNTSGDRFGLYHDFAFIRFDQRTYLTAARRSLGQWGSLCGLIN